jgi:uncharacterized protein YecE (DUF72 family)
MLKIIVGCAGWSYDDWVGPFYPKTLKKDHFLSYYAKFFDFTEINSTFYNLPTDNVVKQWMRSTPENFRFSVKVWQKITHERGASKKSAVIDAFFTRLEVLAPKIKGYLLQFPPKFKYTKANYKYSIEILEEIPAEKPLFIEFRDNAWFDPEILTNFIDGSHVVLVTNYKEGVQPIYLPMQSTYYIRLVGDRELTEFNRIQRSQDEILEEVKQKLNSFERSPEVREALVNFNNHFRGFSPEDANEFKRSMRLPYHEIKMQRTLTDFISKKVA